MAQPHTCIGKCVQIIIEYMVASGIRWKKISAAVSTNMRGSNVHRTHTLATRLSLLLILIYELELTLFTLALSNAHAPVRDGRDHLITLLAISFRSVFPDTKRCACYRLHIFHWSSIWMCFFCVLFVSFPGCVCNNISLWPKSSLFQLFRTVFSAASNFGVFARFHSKDSVWNIRANMRPLNIQCFFPFPIHAASFCTHRERVLFNDSSLLLFTFFSGTALESWR